MTNHSYTVTYNREYTHNDIRTKLMLVDVYESAKPDSENDHNLVKIYVPRVFTGTCANISMMRSDQGLIDILKWFDSIGCSHPIVLKFSQYIWKGTNIGIDSKSYEYRILLSIYCGLAAGVDDFMDSTFVENPNFDIYKWMVFSIADVFKHGKSQEPIKPKTAIDGFNEVLTEEASELLRVYGLYVEYCGQVMSETDFNEYRRMCAIQQRSFGEIEAPLVRSLMAEKRMANMEEYLLFANLPCGYFTFIPFVHQGSYDHLDHMDTSIAICHLLFRLTNDVISYPKESKVFEPFNRVIELVKSGHSPQEAMQSVADRCSRLLFSIETVYEHCPKERKPFILHVIRKVAQSIDVMLNATFRYGWKNV